MRSIICPIKQCFITGEVENLHKHHVLNGPLRDWADKNGLWIYLSEEKHRELHDKNPMLARKLKRIAQYCYEQYHSRELWMKHVHKNYLNKPLTDAEINEYHLIHLGEFYDTSQDDILSILSITNCKERSEK